MRGRLALPLALVLAVVLVSGGCDSSTEPESYDWAGTWTGWIADTYSGPGELTLSLSHTGDQVTGWGTLVLTNLDQTLTGEATGTVTETQLSLTVATVLPFSCAIAVVGTRSGDTVTGTYERAVCPAQVGGTFSISKL